MDRHLCIALEEAGFVPFDKGKLPALVKATTDQQQKWLDLLAENRTKLEVELRNDWNADSVQIMAISNTIRSLLVKIEKTVRGTFLTFWSTPTEMDFCLHSFDLEKSMFEGPLEELLMYSKRTGKALDNIASGISYWTNSWNGTPLWSGTSPWKFGTNFTSPLHLESTQVNADTTCRFCQLPLELRDQIYEFCYPCIVHYSVITGSIIGVRNHDYLGGQKTALPLLNKQIRHEFQDYVRRKSKYGRRLVVLIFLDPSNIPDGIIDSAIDRAGSEPFDLCLSLSSRLGNEEYRRMIEKLRRLQPPYPETLVKSFIVVSRFWANLQMNCCAEISESFNPSGDVMLLTPEDTETITPTTSKRFVAVAGGCDSGHAERVECYLRKEQLSNGNFGIFARTLSLAILNNHSFCCQCDDRFYVPQIYTDYLESYSGTANELPRQSIAMGRILAANLIATEDDALSYREEELLDKMLLK